MQTTIPKSISRRISEYQNLLAETITKYENEEISFKEAAVKWKKIQALKKEEKTKIKKSKNDMSDILLDQLYDRTF